MAGESKLFRHFKLTVIRYPVNTLPLAPRPLSSNGREIHFSLCDEADADIPLEKRLRSEYPEIKWRRKKTYPAHPLESDETKSGSDLIQGVAW